jgi:polar amino acid transport system permease protein
MRDFIETYFNPHDLRASVPDVWSGFQTNLKMMVIAESLVLALALALAVVRGLPGRPAFPLRALAVLYTDLFRGVPLILVALMIGFGLPQLNAGFISQQSFLVYGVAALVLVYTAYVTEVYRAGIESVHPSQRAAARSLGLTYGQTMRYVVLPQAIRRVVPPLLNDFIGLQKDTAIITVIGVVEALNLAQNYSVNYGSFAGYTIAALFFIVLTIPVARFTDHLIAKRERRERAVAM